MKTAIELIAEERQRQIDAEGYTAEHDDDHADFSLSRAGACYALAADTATPSEHPYRFWPWEAAAWKPSLEDPIRDLVKAGALIAAEIDRLQRAERRFQEEGWRSQL